MFAIFFHKSLTAFYAVLTSFPTALWTVLLLLLVFYWLVAMMGLVEIDSLDFDLPEGVATNTDMDMDFDADASNMSVFASVMVRFGLYGIPFVITLSILGIIGWVLSYYANYIVNDFFPNGIMHYVIGTGILLASLFISMIITGRIVKPLRLRFNSKPQRNHHEFLGKTAVVRTSRVDANFGEAILEDGGAGLIFKVRSKNKEFKLHDKVVLVDYLDNENAYSVISEVDFNNG